MTLSVSSNNGQAPPDALAQLPGWNDAGSPHTAPHVTAASYARIRAAMGAAGLGDLVPTDPGWSCYRDRDAQQYMRDIGLTTIPVGQSIHGEWDHGSAVDFEDLGGYGAPRHQWLVDHGAEHGWYQPGWAQQWGSLPEPWHWEYDQRGDTHDGEEVADMTPDESQRLTNIENAVGRLDVMWTADDRRNRVGAGDETHDWSKQTTEAVGRIEAELAASASVTRWTPANVIALIAFTGLVALVLVVLIYAAATGTTPENLTHAALYLAFVIAGGVLGRLVGSR